jgi:hypothetical protein
LLLDAQEQVDTSGGEASLARDFVRADIVTSAIPILDESDLDESDLDESDLDESDMARTSKFNVRTYIPEMNMDCMIFILIGIVVVLLRETLFAKKGPIQWI